MLEMKAKIFVKNLVANGAFSENIQTGGGEDMKFPEVSKKQYVEFPGVNKKQSGISNGDQEEIMWNFQGSLFLVLEFPRD